MYAIQSEDNIVRFPGSSRAPEKRAQGAPRVEVDREGRFLRTPDGMARCLRRSDITGRQRGLFDVVLEKTYRFGKEFDWIALKQFALEVDYEGDRKNLRRSLDDLVDRKVLLRRGPNVYGPNPVISEWVLRKKAGKKQPKKQGVKNNPQGVKNDPERGQKQPQKRSGITPTIEETLQENKTSSSQIALRPGDQPELQPASTGPDPEDSKSSPKHKSATPAVKRPGAAVQSPNGKKWGSAEDLVIAKEIYAGRVTVTGDHKEPNWGDWANDVRLMREADKRKPEHIRALFAWANQDDFWSVNVLCPRKLRDKWAQLAAKRNQQRTPRAHSGRPDDIDWDGTGWGDRINDYL